MGKEVSPFNVHHKVPELKLPKLAAPETKQTHGYFIEQEWIRLRRQELLAKKASKV